MSTKLEEGFRLLNKAGHDKDLLTSALLAFHGALEDFFREQVGDNNHSRRSSWPELLQSWEKDRVLTVQDKETIRAFNKKRNLAAHGSAIFIIRADVEQYGRFVQSFIRRHRFNLGHPKTFWEAILYGVLGSFLDSPNRQKTKASPGSCLKIAGVLLFIPILFFFCIFSSFFSLLNALLTPFTPDRGVVETATPAFVLQETELRVDSEETTPLLPPPTPIWVTPIGTKATISVQVLPADVYSGPGTQFELIDSITIVQEYEIIELSADARWYKIQLNAGSQGWIQAFQAFLVSE